MIDGFITALLNWAPITHPWYTVCDGRRLSGPSSTVRYLLASLSLEKDDLWPALCRLNGTLVAFIRRQDSFYILFIFISK